MGPRGPLREPPSSRGALDTLHPQSPEARSLNHSPSSQRLL